MLVILTLGVPGGSYRPVSLSNCRYYHKEYDVASSYPLEMYSLNIWVTGIDITKCINPQLDCVKEKKSSLEPNALKYDILKEISEKYDETWFKVYTDGSKDTRGKGAAYYVYGREEREMFKITTEVSIMTVELFAIYRAILYIKSVKLSKNVIFTDSKSALQHIARCASGSRGVMTAYNILQLIHELNTNSTKLKLQWMPSHVDIKGNEEADKLAKLAILNGLHCYIKPYYSEILVQFTKECFELWKKYFDEISLSKGIWYKTMQHEPPHVPWFGNVDISRNYIVLLHRLRSGHFPSNKFAYLMKKSDTPNCEMCGKIDDVQHLLVECDKNRANRESLIKLLNIKTSDVGAFQYILAEPTSSAAKLLCKMLINDSGSV